MSKKFYEKTDKTEIYSLTHFSKAIRYGFFGKFIFCIDVYPSQITFAFLIAYTGNSWWQLKSRQWHLFTI